jgi:hypothetical protein
MLTAVVQDFAPGLLCLVFLANALGVIDPRRARLELVGAGVPERLARPGVTAGRILQLAGSVGPFFAATRPWAALALAGSA